MGLTFEWDSNKAHSNVLKHGVSFREAATAFGDPASVTIEDPSHSQDEDRWILLGNSHQNQLLVVVHTLRGQNIRIISARKATPKERRNYEQ